MCKKLHCGRALHMRTFLIIKSRLIFGLMHVCTKAKGHIDGSANFKNKISSSSPRRAKFLIHRSRKRYKKSDLHPLKFPTGEPRLEQRKVITIKIAKRTELQRVSTHFYFVFFFALILVSHHTTQHSSFYSPYHQRDEPT